MQQENFYENNSLNRYEPSNSVLSQTRDENQQQVKSKQTSYPQRHVVLLYILVATGLLLVGFGSGVGIIMMMRAPNNDKAFNDLKMNVSMQQAELKQTHDMVLEQLIRRNFNTTTAINDLKIIASMMLTGLKQTNKNLLQQTMAFLPKSCELVATQSGNYLINMGGAAMYTYCKLSKDGHNLVTPGSCNEIEIKISGNQVIRPAGHEPFIVRCSYTPEKTITSIGHDSLIEIKGTACEPRGCYTRNVTYKATMEQMIAIIEASTHCRQFIKYRCSASQTLIKRYAWWIGRNGSKSFYWGGATSHRDNYCACGETGTCFNTAKKCNCDANDRDVELSDEGYLDDKNKLPVTSMSFGDMGDRGEHGWHTLGPLECWG